MRIGIYGGTFNPPHNGHVLLARTFLEQAALDEVWLLVSPQNPFKAADALPPDEWRLRLVRAAVEDEPRLVASDFESHLPRPSYTWNTLQALTAAYPQHTFALLVGGDNWAAFHRWSHPQDIIAHHHLYIYPRPGEPLDPSSLPRNVHVLQGRLLPISSTDIRQRLSRGEDITPLVPPKVAALLAYASEQNLGKM